ncbi:MAG: MarR family winged helix-turn-helix transcriptional regulator [Myxococcota bacterium]
MAETTSRAGFEGGGADRDPGAGPSETIDDILRGIRRILRRVSQHSRAVAREARLTVPQLMCLKAIGEAPEAEEMHPSLLSRRVHLSPATITGIADRLETAGLVVRERRLRDRRKVCLSLTEAGRRRLDALPPPLQERFVGRLRALPDQERLHLLTALDRIAELMEASDLDASPILAPGDIRRKTPE